MPKANKKMTEEDWLEFYELFYKLTSKDEKKEEAGNWGEGERYILSEMSLYKLIDLIKSKISNN